MKPVLKWLLLSPFLLLLSVVILFLLALSVTEANKAYWDYKVRKWCKKDGGVTVYERVALTKDEYNNIETSNGYLFLPFERKARSSDRFYLSYRTFIIHDSNPKVTKTEKSIVRASDKKTLSTIVTYGRGGGDVIVIDHPSYFSCNIDQNVYKKFNSVIRAKGE